MSVSEFFAYLMKDRCSRELAVELVDAYRARTAPGSAATGR